MSRKVESSELRVESPKGDRSENSQPSTLNSQLPLSPNQKAWRCFKNHRLAVGCGLFLLAMVITMFAWPLVSAYQPDTVSDAQFQPPSAQHWLGTDVHGRDLSSRIFFGARVSLLVGLVGAGVSLVIGVLWGAVAGYLGGRWDNFLMRVVDVLYALPSIIFVIVLVTTLHGFVDVWQSSEVAGKLPNFAAFLSHLGIQLKPITPDWGRNLKFIGLFAGLGAVSWLTMARIVRGQVLSLRTRQFVLASQALGASHARILVRHIFPNVLGIVIVYLTLTVPGVVLYESFLSYLGLGIQPPQASLGTLIAEGAAQINPVRVYWWLVACPGTLLALMLLALNLVGDGLREALDPRGEA